MADAQRIGTDTTDKAEGIMDHEQIVWFEKGNDFTEYVGFDLLVRIRCTNVFYFSVGPSLPIKRWRWYRIWLQKDESSCTA